MSDFGLLPDVPAQGGPDLWCTYAAVRTMTWLGRADGVVGADATADYVLSRGNPDGGFAWSRGMPSDAWATFYSASALTDLGHRLPDPDRTLDWLRTTWTGDAYAMTPGQEAEVWATHFSTRTAVEICGADVPDRQRLLAWLGRLQTRDGGLAWSIGHARAGEADVRACYYGVAAWRALCRLASTEPPWDVPALVAWLRERQDTSGGFRFSPGADVPCMWATYRAVGALAALGEEPARPCSEWILAQRDSSGAFLRWPGYAVADVWASFCAVGALKALDAPIEPVADAVDKGLAAMACPEGGFTYREPGYAADALSTAAAALVARDDDPLTSRLRRWLEGCLLPNEGGVMYMPGRGAEIRCTAWALAAGAFRDSPRDLSRILRWLSELQNPDGGFGYWHGRGSDMVSSAAAVEIHRLAGADGPTPFSSSALAAFVDQCASGDGYANVPRARPALRPGLHALRILNALDRADPFTADALLARHRVRGGGWANEGNRVPDLLSTYEAVVTADLHRLDVEPAHLTAYLDRTASPAGAAWSPLAPATEDPLAVCLHGLLRIRAGDPSFRLPALTLS
ncbi:prenyltransferase/squalene oxidase repeat-containing protein [Nocardiopsis sp. M1B1]|uniref:prenyltransferase/squalene oxidase repeat-containing protein n=1 Tax=Nocardiopsis sp. M1B1 TaxID=3450454 RepID=UPI004039AA7B